MSRTPKPQSDRLELRKLEADDADGRREQQVRGDGVLR